MGRCAGSRRTQNDNDSSTNDQTQSDLVLSAGGRSASIVQDRTSQAWKTVPDFGWKVEQVAGGADGQPYWKITSQEGQVWRFGHNRDAQWQTPYVGDEHDPLGWPMSRATTATTTMTSRQPAPGCGGGTWTRRSTATRT